jgi:hypothetical protein
LSPVNKLMIGELVCFAESGLGEVGMLPGSNVLLPVGVAVSPCVGVSAIYGHCRGLLKWEVSGEGIIGMEIGLGTGGMFGAYGRCGRG